MNWIPQLNTDAEDETPPPLPARDSMSPPSLLGDETPPPLLPPKPSKMLVATFFIKSSLGLPILISSG